MAFARGGWVASLMVWGVAAGCDGVPLTTPDAGVPHSLVIPADVVTPGMSCSDGSRYTFSLPCELGMSPSFETDCSYGAGNDQILRFILPGSLPDTGGGLVTGPPLGTPQRFQALFVPPPNAQISSGALEYGLTSMVGTVTFTKGSLSNRTLDGWFQHLDFVFTSGENEVSCTLDNGRFTTVPGNYL